MKKLLSIILLICVILCFPSCSEDKSGKGDDANTTNGDIAPYTSYTANTAVCFCGHPYNSYEWRDFVESEGDEDDATKLVFFNGKIFFAKGEKRSMMPSNNLANDVEAYYLKSFGENTVYFDYTNDNFLGVSRMLDKGCIRKELKIQEKKKSISKEKAEKTAKKLASKFVEDISVYDMNYSKTNTSYDGSKVYIHSFYFSKKCGEYETPERICINIGPSGKCLYAFANQPGIYDDITCEISREKVKESVEQKIQNFYNRHSDVAIKFEIKLQSYELGDEYMIVSDGYVGILTKYSAKYEISIQGEPFEAEETHDYSYIFTVIEYIGE